MLKRRQSVQYSGDAPYLRDVRDSPTMPSLARSSLVRYGIAPIAVILATTSRLVLDPVLGHLFPFAPLSLAILVVAGYAGRGPALLATGLGAATSARFLLPPREGLAVEGFENQAGLV